ncbi:uncharacterized protein PAC_09237 [Phialocephala subalpina]|uniref:F-box domain-containing protein n=1 Tax=Phialocephala subalpina TaxID=576137 RepID=A0A1L7X2S9_9HELO|nr:uncharacterized protein PAC_09237 [Phialocephala subalpina]
MSIRHPTDLTLAMAGTFDTSLSSIEEQDAEDDCKPDPRKAKKLTLDSLPADVLRTIFDALPDVSSVCLGLTCTALYPLHRAKYGTVKLTRFIDFGKRHIRITELVRDFFPGLMFYPKLSKYVSISRYHRLTLKDLKEHRRRYGLPQIGGIHVVEQGEGWLTD